MSVEIHMREDNPLCGMGAEVRETYQSWNGKSYDGREGQMNQS